MSTVCGIPFVLIDGILYKGCQHKEEGVTMYFLPNSF